MSDFYYFSTCPNCGYDSSGFGGYMDYGELSGYEGDTVKCSKCKTKFILLMTLVERKKK